MWICVCVECLCASLCRGVAFVGKTLIYTAVSNTAAKNADVNIYTGT